MPGIDAKAYEKVKQGLLLAVHTAGNRSFGLSQINCPVKTGFLKRSGQFRAVNEGAIITYTAPYASIVERGTRGGTVHVQTYAKKDGTVVSGYSYSASPREGRHFIENGLRTGFSRFADDVDEKLRLSFKNVQRI